MQPIVDDLAEVGLAEEVIDDIEALVDGFFFFQGEHQPTTQQTTAHRRYRLVYDVEQRLAVFLHGADEL